jgi:hypothetical protein
MKEKKKQLEVELEASPALVAKSVIGRDPQLVVLT